MKKSSIMPWARLSSARLSSRSSWARLRYPVSKLRPSSACPANAVTNQELGRCNRDHDDRLDQLHHREGDLVEYLQGLAGHEQHREQEADDHHDDRIVARQE